MKAELQALIKKAHKALITRSKALTVEFLEELGRFETKAKNENWRRIPRDGFGKWTAGGATVGVAYDPDKGKWVNEKGTPVPAKLQKELTEKQIPKSWIGVKLNPNKDEGCIAVGYFLNPTTGEVSAKKALYSAQHQGTSYKAKFDILRKFDKVKENIEKVAYKEAVEGKPAAQVTYIIQETAQRVGSGRSLAEKKNTGLGVTDLKAKHVTVRGNAVIFDYKGKGGKRYHKTFHDAKMATIVKIALLDDAGQTKKANDRLFNVTADTVRTYMRTKGGKPAAELIKLSEKSNLGKFGAHYYRYWHATKMAAKAIKLRGKPSSKSDASRIKKAICEDVADFLNNKPSMAYEKYISPTVWQVWDDDVAPASPRLSRKSVSEDDEESADYDMAEFFDSIEFVGDDDGEWDIGELFPDDEDGDPEETGEYQRDVLDKIKNDEEV